MAAFVNTVNVAVVLIRPTGSAAFRQITRYWPASAACAFVIVTESVVEFTTLLATTTKPRRHSKLNGGGFPDTVTVNVTGPPAFTV